MELEQRVNAYIEELNNLRNKYDLAIVSEEELYFRDLKNDEDVPYEVWFHKPFIREHGRYKIKKEK